MRAVLFSLLCCVIASSSLPSLNKFLNFPLSGNLQGCTTKNEFEGFKGFKGAKGVGANFVAWVETAAGKIDVKVSVIVGGVSRANITLNDQYWPKSAGYLVQSITFDNECEKLYISTGPNSDVNPQSLKSIPAIITYIYDIAEGKFVSQANFRHALAGLAPCPNCTHHGEALFTARNEMGYQALYRYAWPTNSESEVFAVKLGEINDITQNPVYPSVLAFSNARFDHAFIGLCSDLSTSPNTITWVGPSIDFDFGPVWSPDGHKLGFIRLYDNTDLHDQAGKLHQGRPFSVMVAEIAVDDQGAKATKVTELYRDWVMGWPGDTNGFGQRKLVWTSDGRLLFGSEAAVPSVVGGTPGAPGFLHVIAVDSTASGLGSAVDLTPGKGCEHLDWVTDHTNNFLYVVHNCDFTESRAIARIELSSGKRVAVVNGGPYVVSGMGVESVGVTAFPDGVAYLGSQWDLPSLPLYQSFGGAPSALSSSAARWRDNQSTTGSAFVRPTLVTLNSTDGAFALSGQLFRKATVKPNGAAILFTHGGSQRQMYGAFHFCDVYAQLYAVNQYLANLGYTVLSLNYRSGVGYGHRFRACEGCGSFGGKEYLDVLLGGKFLAQDAPRGVGVYGLSYGGLNTLQALTRNSDVFAAGVANAPVFNWITTGRTAEGVRLYDPAPQLHSGFNQLPVGPEPDLANNNWLQASLDNQQQAWESSPSGHVDGLKSPLLLIQGDLDNEVDFQESRGVMRALRRLRGELAFDQVEALVFPDENHGLALYSHQLEAAQATADFFDQKLLHIDEVASK